MKILETTLIATIVIMVMLVAGCFYDSEEYLFPTLNTQCDTVNITYAASVIPILDNHCLSCHSNSTAAAFGGNIALEDLLIQWNEIRDKLPGLLAEIKPEKKDDPVFQHPYGGPLDIADTLQFFEVHFDNHMRHIDRILAQANG